MTKEEFNNWVKEHGDSKITVKTFETLGFKYVKVTGEPGVYGYWLDENGEKVAVFMQSVEPVICTPQDEQKMFEKFVKTFEMIDHYTVPINDIMSGKQWYDKFYEHKGRKRRWQR